MIDMQLQFPDKCVTYSTFMEDLSAMVAVKLHTLQDKPERLSQNQAWQEFGKAKVKDWVKRNMIEPIIIRNPRTNRITKLEYRYSELYTLNKNKH